MKLKYLTRENFCNLPKMIFGSGGKVCRDGIIYSLLLLDEYKTLINFKMKNPSLGLILTSGY